MITRTEYAHSTMVVQGETAEERRRRWRRSLDYYRAQMILGLSDMDLERVERNLRLAQRLMDWIADDGALPDPFKTLGLRPLPFPHTHPSFAP